MTPRKEIEVRPATRADIDSFAGERANMPFRMYVYSGIMDGECVALGGFAINPVSGAAIIFLDTIEGLTKQYPIKLVKMARKVIKEIKAKGFSHIIALCDDEIDRAEEFLEWLGFIKRGNEYVYEGK